MSRQDASSWACPRRIPRQRFPVSVIHLQVSHGCFPPSFLHLRLEIAFSPFPLLPVPFLSPKSWQRLVRKSDYEAGGSERNMIYTQRERSSRPWPPPPRPWMAFSSAGCGSIEVLGEVKADKPVEMAQMVALIMMMMNMHFGKEEEEEGGVFCVQYSVSA